MEQIMNTDTRQSFSLRKIPTDKHNITFEVRTDDDKDKTKILELSNIIDNWEREVLFSENGFFALKGKNVQGKTKEFIRELNNFINGEISKIKFLRAGSYETISRIKEEKLAAIKRQMEEYEIKQLKEWEISVFEEALNSTIERARLYVRKSSVVNSSYKNALEILKTMAEKEDWDEKTLKNKKEDFESEFYLTLINSLIKERDVSGAILYEKVKNKIKTDEKEKTEKSLKKFKNTLISYNFARELFSYNLSEKENEKEIKSVNDEEKEILIRKFLSDFKREKSTKSKKEESEKNEENWLDIIEKIKTEQNGATLYINTFLDEKSQNAKKKYIEKILKDGFITTDKNLFIELLTNASENFEKFKTNNLSDFRADLSSEDFKIIENLKKMNDFEITMYISDFNYLKKEFSALKTINKDEIYLTAKSVLEEEIRYKETNKKSADLQVRNGIIKNALERYLKHTGEDKNDCIINNSGK